MAQNGPFVKADTALFWLKMGLSFGTDRNAPLQPLAGLSEYDRAENELILIKASRSHSALAGTPDRAK
jgi:hypothetical protein